MAIRGAADAAGSMLSQEIEDLKNKLGQQQKQLDQLRSMLEAQNRAIERLAQSHETAAAGSTLAHLSAQPAEVLNVAAADAAMAPTASPGMPPVPGSAPPAPAAAQVAAASSERSGRLSPLSVGIGSAYLTPVAFMDFTTFFRSTDTGSGIGTNFGSIPFNNTPAGRLTENRLSAQHSRIGLRVDANVRGAQLIGYWESDFAGFAPGNLAVTANNAGLRLRLYWVDLRKNKWEFLAGQSWSMLTSNRRGLSPLPADIFSGRNIDINYQLGLAWARDPQFRVVYHPTSKMAWGVSLESPEQYIGGANGGGVVTLPSALASPYGSQLNNGTTTIGVPNLHPDVVSKIAFDGHFGSHSAHLEAGGVIRSFKVFNPLSSRTFTSMGGGGTVNFNLEVVKNLYFYGNTFFSDGGGRYIFGQAPDLIIRADGSPSLIHSLSTIGGLEYERKNWLLYAYYGGLYIGRNSAVDPAAGKSVGYGFSGSSNSSNRTIQEPTFGVLRTFWSEPKYGALSFMVQYSYLTRSPWFVDVGQPKAAHANMVFTNLRYTLPGSAPDSTELGLPSPASDLHR